jgi:hypothetical protein
MTRFISGTLIAIFILAGFGCATASGQSDQGIKKSTLGAGLLAVLGYTLCGGKAQLLCTVGGAVVGYVAGGELDKKDAEKGTYHCHANIYRIYNPDGSIREYKENNEFCESDKAGTGYRTGFSAPIVTNPPLPQRMNELTELQRRAMESGLPLSPEVRPIPQGCQRFISQGNLLQTCINSYERELSYIDDQRRSEQAIRAYGMDSLARTAGARAAREGQ